MLPEDVTRALSELREAVPAMFGPHHESRLAQFDSAMATALMAVEHLADEQVRELELAKRRLDRATVHGSDEVMSPLGHGLEHARAVLAHAAEGK